MTQDAIQDNPVKPWWKEPWPWILMSGPFIVIIACIVTIVLAMQSYGDQAILDGGFKRGLVVSKPAVSSEGAASASESAKP